MCIISLMRSTQTQTIFLILAALMSFSTCASRTESLSSLSASFQKNHDGRSLNGLLGHLRLGLPQAEVERLLGKPDYSPIEGQFYYSTSDLKTGEGTPLGLIVEYRSLNVRTGEMLLTRKLESVYFGPVGE